MLFTGQTLEDIYKYVSIDFVRSDNGSTVGVHSASVFAYESFGTFNGRRDFATWAEGKFKIPKALKKRDYADTLTVHYRIDREGRMADVRISDYSASEVAASLKKLLLASPRWTPVLTENRTPIDIMLEDCWIVRFENDKPQIELYTVSVYRNDVSAPHDLSICKLRRMRETVYICNPTALMSLSRSMNRAVSIGVSTWINRYVRQGNRRRKTEMFGRITTGC